MALGVWAVIVSRSEKRSSGNPYDRKKRGVA
jgi:hypothetical protein